jgi:Mycothiol maleylpyruvate isomerase N-terminal domain
MTSSSKNASLLAAAAAYDIRLRQPRHANRSFLATPCAGWVLAMLLRHVNDSLTAMHQGIAADQVGPPTAAPGTGDQGMNLVATFCDLACGLLAASASADRQDRPIIVADRYLPGSLLIFVAAVEVAVHGWEIARHVGATSRSRLPSPPDC